jgi:hypothetical protein
MEGIVKLASRLGAATIVAGLASECLYDGKQVIVNFVGSKLILQHLVDGGRRAVIFDKVYGIQKKVVGEGTHFRIPFFQVGQ